MTIAERIANEYDGTGTGNNVGYEVGGSKKKGAMYVIYENNKPHISHTNYQCYYPRPTHTQKTNSLTDRQTESRS